MLPAACRTLGRVISPPPLCARRNLTNQTISCGNRHAVLHDLHRLLADPEDLLLEVARRHALGRESNLHGVVWEPRRLHEEAVGRQRQHLAPSERQAVRDLVASERAYEYGKLVLRVAGGGTNGMGRINENEGGRLSMRLLARNGRITQQPWNVAEMSATLCSADTYKLSW